jgi:hypothetical protein
MVLSALLEDRIADAMCLHVRAETLTNCLSRQKVPRQSNSRADRPTGNPSRAVYSNAAEAERF